MHENDIYKTVTYENRMNLLTAQTNFMKFVKGAVYNSTLQDCNLRSYELEGVLHDTLYSSLPASKSSKFPNGSKLSLIHI